MKKFILILFLVGILLVSGVFTALAAEAPVTITWWHIQVAEAEKVLWQRLADEYMAAHPNVTIEVLSLENENFKTKLTTVMLSGERFSVPLSVSRAIKRI